MATYDLIGDVYDLVYPDTASRKMPVDGELLPVQRAERCPEKLKSGVFKEWRIFHTPREWGKAH